MLIVALPSSPSPHPPHTQTNPAVLVSRPFCTADFPHTTLPCVFFSVFSYISFSVCISFHSVFFCFLYFVPHIKRLILLAFSQCSYTLLSSLYSLCAVTWTRKTQSHGWTWCWTSSRHTAARTKTTFQAATRRWRLKRRRNWRPWSSDTTGSWDLPRRHRVRDWKAAQLLLLLTSAKLNQTFMRLSARSTFCPLVWGFINKSLRLVSLAFSRVLISTRLYFASQRFI